MGPCRAASGSFFYEKQCPSHRPDWVKTEPVWSRHNKRTIDFCLANDVPTLVWLANLADIELHTSTRVVAIDPAATTLEILAPGFKPRILPLSGKPGERIELECFLEPEGDE